MKIKIKIKLFQKIHQLTSLQTLQQITMEVSLALKNLLDYVQKQVQMQLNSNILRQKQLLVMLDLKNLVKFLTNQNGTKVFLKPIKMQV